MKSLRCLGNLSGLLGTMGLLQECLSFGCFYHIAYLSIYLYIYIYIYIYLLYVYIYML